MDQLVEWALEHGIGLALRKERVAAAGTGVRVVWHVDFWRSN
jgi:hypothetical protein